MKRTLGTLVMLLSLSTPFALFASEMEDGVEGAKEMLLDESATISTDAPVDAATPVVDESASMSAPDAAAVDATAPVVDESATMSAPEVMPTKPTSEEANDSAEHEMHPDADY